MGLSTLEIIGGALLLITSLFMIIVILLQESKQPGMNSVVGGGSTDSYFGQNSGRSNEAKLVRLTKVMTTIFFVVTIVVNLFAIFTK